MVASPRRVLAVVLFAAGCFGLGLAVARLAGWATPAPPPPGATGAAEHEPAVYLDAGSIVLFDGSLKLDPPEPPRLPPREPPRR